MVFMPAVSTFVISNLLGGSKQTLIGNLVEQQFLVLNNWHFGSSISVILMVFILLFMAILNRAEKDNEGGATLW
jgi:spermidine/putrescine transport system permease protein